VLKDSIPIVCLDDSNPIVKSLGRDDAELRGRDAVIIESWWHTPHTAIEQEFQRVEELPRLFIVDHGRPVLGLELRLGHNLQGLIIESEAQGWWRRLVGS